MTKDDFIIRGFNCINLTSHDIGGRACGGVSVLVRDGIPSSECTLKVPATPACTWWNCPEEDLSSGKLESSHPFRTFVKSIEVFYGVESVVRSNADSLFN